MVVAYRGEKQRKLRAFLKSCSWVRFDLRDYYHEESYRETHCKYVRKSFSNNQSISKLTSVTFNKCQHSSRLGMLQRKVK